jgi:hypothetical protein
MPDAFTMNSAEEFVSACTDPSAMASAWRRLCRATYSLNEVTSSSLEMEWGGVKRPVPLIAMEAKLAIPLI